jgi:hypothetical protein
MRHIFPVFYLEIIKDDPAVLDGDAFGDFDDEVLVRAVLQLQTAARPSKNRHKQKSKNNWSLHRFSITKYL